MCSFRVCALITPWNYPLMMLSWKMAACLAAGNTVIIKPAQVCPLTALKFAELSVRAGIPPGVINVVPGTGMFGRKIQGDPISNLKKSKFYCYQLDLLYMCDLVARLSSTAE